MNIVTKYIFLKQILIIRKNYLPERKKVEKVENLICSIENKEKYLHKSFKTSVKSWVKTKKSAQSNSV